jgi:hypothetical protein
MLLRHLVLVVVEFASVHFSIAPINGYAGVGKRLYFADAHLLRHGTTACHPSTPAKAIGRIRTLTFMNDQQPADHCGAAGC